MNYRREVLYFAPVWIRALGNIGDPRHESAAVIGGIRDDSTGPFLRSLI
jgi:hypothetical protein